MTYSIVGCDDQHLGVATASHWVAVGAVVPWAEPGVGAVATQAFTEPSYGSDGLARMRGGEEPEQALTSTASADAGRDFRQVAMIDSLGRTATLTGTSCFPHAASEAGPNVVVAGNMLASPDVPRSMVAAFDAATGDLADRLILALRAGESAGGDARGRQAAAMRVVARCPASRAEEMPVVDLRVDDHADPVAELTSLLDLHRQGSRITAAAFPPAQTALVTGDQTETQQVVDELARIVADVGDVNIEARLWLALAYVRSGRQDEVNRVTQEHPGLRATVERWAQHLVSLNGPLDRRGGAAPSLCAGTGGRRGGAP